MQQCNNNGNGSNGTNRPIRSQRAPMKEIITLDDPNELDEVSRDLEDFFRAF
jgi:hypothetical protein